MEIAEQLVEGSVFDGVMFKILMALIALLLAVVAFFLKKLHSDFSNMREQMGAFITRLAVKEETDMAKEAAVSGRMKSVEDRVLRLEEFHWSKESN